MNNDEYSRDSLAIILLCSNLAINYKIDSIKPFTSLEWSRFAKIILNSNIKRPGNLFNLAQEEIENSLLIKPELADKIVNLLSKAGQLSFELTELKSMGIKIVTRADIDYPLRLKDKLKEKCPPLIYYCGDINISKNQLIGVVGSRNIDDDGLEFTKRIGEKIAKDNYSLVSGGARGADSIAQEAVLKNNGKVVAFIADSMIAKIKKKEIREEITKGKLLLMSANNPRSGFTVYSAMNRNKYIYGLSKITVVISSDFNKGGTWSGALENLKNKWVPIIVRDGKNVPKGNIEIIKQGGYKFNENCFAKSFEECVKNKTTTQEAYYESDLLSLLNTDNKSVKNIPKTEDNSHRNNYDAYELVANSIKNILVDELSLEEFSAKLNVNKKQATDWLNRAITDGIVKKLNRPVRYKSV